MQRRKITRRGEQQQQATEAEYKILAGQFADMLIDPDKHWLLEYVLFGGFTYPIESLDDLAIDILSMRNNSPLIDKKLLDAGLSGDRKTVVTFLMDNFSSNKADEGLAFSRFECSRHY